VTGVQTCALPIYLQTLLGRPYGDKGEMMGMQADSQTETAHCPVDLTAMLN